MERCLYFFFFFFFGWEVRIAGRRGLRLDIGVPQCMADWSSFKTRCYGVGGFRGSEKGCLMPWLEKDPPSIRCHHAIFLHPRKD